MNKFISYLKSGGARLAVAKLLGCFLLVTAGLKLHGMWVDPYGQENFLALPWLQWLTIEVEVLLGLWLLSGVANRLALIVSLGVFTIFAALSFTLAWQGQTDCGCFGKVKVNPWYTFVLDLIIVVFLGTTILKSAGKARLLPCREACESSSPLAKLFINTLQVAGITTVILGVIVLGISLYTGDPWAALANMRGESLTVTPTVTQLGEGIAGETRTFKIQLKNYSDKPINIIGGTTSCSCIATNDLPLGIPARGECFIKVTMKFSGTPGRFVHRFVLYSDGEKPLTIARFSGSVLAQPLMSDQRNANQRTSHGEVLEWLAFKEW